MNDFLDAPVGDFDWGPRHRGLVKPPPVGRHLVLIVLGVAMLALGIILA